MRLARRPWAGGRSRRDSKLLFERQRFFPPPAQKSFALARRREEAAPIQVIRGSWAAPKQRTTTTGISLIVGGILGLAAALGMTHPIKFTTDGASLPAIQTASVILSFAFAVLSGIYPAWSASRIAPIAPIEALRYG